MVLMVGCQTVLMTPADDTSASVSAGGSPVSGGSTAVFTMREAARVAGVSVSTLRRRRDELTAAGAVIDPNGWQVPITALIAAGLISGEGHPADDNDTPAAETSRASDAATANAPDEDPGAGVRVRQLEQQVQDLNEQLHHWQRRAEVAEARAEERARSLEVLRIANESERLALRMLTTGTHDQHTQHPTATTAPRAEATAVPKPTETETAEQSPGADSARGTRRGGFLRRLFTD